MSQGLTDLSLSLAANVIGIVAAAILPPACQDQITKETDRSQNIKQKYSGRSPDLDF
jgi:hypothetical protein